MNAFLATRGELVVFDDVIATISYTLATERSYPAHVRLAAVLKSVRDLILERGMWQNVVYCHNVQHSQPPEL